MSAQEEVPEAASLCSRSPSRKSGEDIEATDLDFDKYPHVSDKCDWVRTLLLQTGCLLWLLPITVLLVLNFKRYIVGECGSIHDGETKGAI
jgi:hypothetical protein